MTASNQSAGGPYRAKFGTIYHEDASGFLFGVIPASYADDVARSLNLAHRPVPAPSSLAGGEMLDRFERAAFAKVQNLPRGAVERAEEIARRDAEYDAARNAILASLSPKGSARVGAALSFECSNCNVAEPEWCMSAGHCAHRDGALASREEAPVEAGARDYPAEFEAWWATYRHCNRDAANYPVKKQIAFDAFYFGAQPQAREDAQPVAWRLIDSAPKDGTTIDVWREEGGRDTVFWGYPHHECGEMGSLCDSDWHSPRSPGWVCATFNEFVGGKHNPFTHWKPVDGGPNADNAHPAPDALQGDAK